MILKATYLDEITKTVKEDLKKNRESRPTLGRIGENQVIS